jgi:hypothetical protein
MAANDLYTQAQALLDASVMLLGARSPNVAFVSPGTPVFDCCPMLAVHVPSIEEAGTGPQTTVLDAGHRYRHGRLNLSTLIVSIIRCDQETNGSLPDVPAKQATAGEVLEDAWTLWNGLNRMLSDGSLFRGCSERFFDGARAIDSSGGCVGYLITARITIPGWNPLDEVGT